MSIFGGFGQNNNNQQQQGTGFGGFGTNNTSTGFGQPANTGFGSNSNSSGGLFGSNTTNNNNNTNTGFGGFGASTSNTSPFGANRNAFGTATTTTSGGGLFGSSNTATAGSSSGFGGFGTNQPNNTGGVFSGGAPKPAFGTSNTTNTSIFGGGSGTNAFGTNNNSTGGGFSGGGLGTALGTNTTECQGTNSTPFQAYQEKEGNAANTTTNYFQSISFMPPYKNFSFEELRLADYNQGRRFGNASGQAGAFGFSGFGTQQSSNTTANPFGTQSNNTSSPFGGGTQTSNAFGNSNSGGLFGTKPAGGTLFGTNTTTSQPNSNLFGATSNNAPAFGGFGTNSSQQQQQPKPGGFSFGTNANTGSGFGVSATGFGTNSTTNNTAGGLFGNSNQNNNPFGGGQQQQPASNAFGSAFGPNQNQNQSNAPAFGGFGQNQESKPSGLFGASNTSTNTGGGLFGNNNNNNQNSQQQPAGSSIFGANNNQQQSSGSGLFGKPAATGNGLFGSNTTSNTNNAGGNIFGNLGTGSAANQGQQNQGGIFGTNNQQQQKPSLFNTGSSTSNLFGVSNNQQQPAGNSLFSNTNTNQQQQPGGLFGNSTNVSSSLGNSQQQNPLLPPQTLQASLLDSNPWGSASIFSGLPPPPTQNVGPLATPISAAKSKKQSILHPNYKINPYQSQSRLVTPRRGYGFTYSTYGTPSSISSNASTPGAFSGSLLHSSIGRGLGKSLSTSNLRRTFESDGDSILSPGAFSAGSSRFSGAGSLKKLTIDRNLRTDLFANDAVAALPGPDKSDQSKQPGILKKKVSFDTNTVGGNGNGQDGADVNGYSSSEVNHNATPSAQEQGFLRSSRNNSSKSTGQKSNGKVSPPEMEQVKGNELAIVHEDDSPEPSSSANTRPPPQGDQNDPQPGEYYMRPSREELSRMTREQKSKVKDFEIGRKGCGHVIFDLPVDLNEVPLDEIYDNIAVITLRSLTIYPDSARKPRQGHGLNVPSTIYLENSWPRKGDKKTPTYEKSGPRFNKHIDRLRKVGGTEFVRYEKDTGVWVFKVPHFTTYGFDYDDNASEGDNMQTNTLSEEPGTPTPKSRLVRNESASSDLTPLQDSTTSTDIPSYVSSSPDDTFEFRKKKMFPGAFDDAPDFDDDLDMEDTQNDELSFLDDRLAASPSDSGEDEPSDIQVPSDHAEDQSLVVQDDDVDMIGAFPKTDLYLQPKSILKASQQSFDGAGTPRAFDASTNDDWAAQLQKTISPRKQDRHALRGTQANILRDQDTEQGDTPRAKTTTNGGVKDITTSIDLMNSLFGKEQLRRSQRDAKQQSKGKGFEWPYPKRSKTHDHPEVNENDRAFYDSYKPSWGPNSTLIYSKPSPLGHPPDKSTRTGAVALKEIGTLSSDGREIAMAKIIPPKDLLPESLRKQRVRTEIDISKEVPVARALQIPFKELASSVQNNFHREQAVWELAGILFDQIHQDAYAGLPPNDPSTFEFRTRKDNFSIFWERLCQPNARDAVSSAPNAEERALAHLSANKIVEACDALAQGKDFRLSILVSQISGDEIMRDDIGAQIRQWRELNVLSEMTEPIRALYGLLAGNTCICEGKKGPPEDRARTFVISDRFKLDWKRAFGLRLWYAIQASDPVEAAIHTFAEDLKSDEGKKPLPWFIEENAPQAWQDPAPNSRQDLLWGLLRLYASSNGGGPVPALADIVSPHNATCDPLNSRLSFQLYQSLALRFPQTDATKADQLTWDFATQLESSGEWLWSLYAVLHLSNHQQRRLAIESLLARHASSIKDAEYETLTNEFKIPPPWIWSAKALLARSIEDPVAEVEFLVRANDHNEAHAVLCRTVAPKAIIEQDYTTLQPLLEGFKERHRVHGWELGGQVYGDFVSLVQEGVDEKMRLHLLAGLMDLLPGMQEKELEFLEKVAVKEMGRVVGDMAVKERNKDVEKAKILQLPLTDDGYLKHTLSLSYEYYRAVMVGRR